MSDRVKNHWVTNQRDGTGAASPLYPTADIDHRRIDVRFVVPAQPVDATSIAMSSAISSSAASPSSSNSAASQPAFEKTTRNYRASSRSQPSSYAIGVHTT
jgi:hypothetical protein